MHMYIDILGSNDLSDCDTTFFELLFQKGSSNSYIYVDLLAYDDLS